ncbi:MAG: ATP-binding cassette domain-containing protein [Myxococcota bacterium]
MTAAFVLRGVTVAFPQGRGLQPLDLLAQEGEVIALLGASGAGKTTLLRVLAVEQPAGQGQVQVLGTDAEGLGGRARHRLRGDVGLMMQTDNLVEGHRVFHNVAMGNLGRWSTWRSLTTLVWPRRADVAAVTDVLAQVELAERLWDWPRQLSGGERQRVALARLLLQAPRLWLADEPAAGLDPRLRRELLDRLVALVRARGATLVVTLHDVELVGRAFDRVIGMREGRVVFDHAPDRLDATRLGEIYGT